VHAALASLKVEAVKIPERTTHLLQPLDVAINKSFKDALRERWQYWFEFGPKMLTARGNRQKPSYQVGGKSALSIIFFVCTGTRRYDIRISEGRQERNHHNCVSMLWLRHGYIQSEHATEEGDERMQRTAANR
jgi:hypothetical protein